MSHTPQPVLDHLVLTVRDPEATCRFYGRCLGLETVLFGEGRRALRFGRCKINLHQAERELAPHAAHPVPGSADLCFLTPEPLEDLQRRLRNAGIPVEHGPVERTGAVCPLRSIYIRDPDGNLVEIANALCDI